MPSTITTSLLAATFAPSSTKAVSPYETTAETGSGHHQTVDTTTMPFMGLPPRDEMDALAALPRLTHQEAVDVSNYQSPIVMSLSCLPRRQLKQHKPDISLSAHNHNKRAVPMDAPFNPRRAVQPNPAERALWAFKQRRYAARGLTEKPKPTRTTMTFEKRPVVQPPQREQEQQKQSQLARLLAQHGDDSSSCAPAAAFRRDTQAYQRVRFAGEPEAYRQRRGQHTMPPRARSPPPRQRQKQQKHQKHQQPVVVVNDDPEIQAILDEVDALFDYLPTVHTTTTTKNQSPSQRDADISASFPRLSTRRFTPYQFEYDEFSSSSSSSEPGSSSQEIDEEEEEGDGRLYCDDPESDDSDSDSDHDEDEDEDDDGDDDPPPPPLPPTTTSAPSPAPAPAPQPNNPHAARFKQLFGAGYDVNDLPDAFDDGDDEDEDEDDDFI